MYAEEMSGIEYHTCDGCDRQVPEKELIYASNSYAIFKFCSEICLDLFNSEEVLNGREPLIQ